MTAPQLGHNYLWKWERVRGLLPLFASLLQEPLGRVALFGW